jgi:hypothetical protein
MHIRSEDHYYWSNPGRYYRWGLLKIGPILGSLQVNTTTSDPILGELVILVQS